MDILRTPVTQGSNDVYIVYELVDTDLHQIIRSPQELTDPHFQFFIYQVRVLIQLNATGLWPLVSSPNELNGS